MLKFETVIELSNGPEKWQQMQWEENIVINTDQIKSTTTYCIPELVKEIYQRSFPLTNYAIKIGKTLTKRSVLDYYPVCVNQNDFFLEMDRRFFPIVFNEDDIVSKHIRDLPPKFHKIYNGEMGQICDFDSFSDLTPTALEDRIYLYETSEQHAPFRMQPLLTSQLIAYCHDENDVDCSIGIPRQMKRKSPFYGSLSDNIPYQLALENEFFRVPVYQHEARSTDFLLILNGDRFAIRKLDGMLLAGKQMPLAKIHNPKSMFFRKIMMVN